VGLFDNPFYREQMYALGLRPETAYGCAYDFLLYPQSKARLMPKPEEMSSAIT
jgi:hypothetical protein